MLYSVLKELYMHNVIKRVLNNQGYKITYDTLTKAWSITREDDRLFKLQCRNLSHAYKMLSINRK